MLGLAGEYAVASELCRRGLYSQLTLGNYKRTDILVETSTRVVRISVKAKQGNEWPAVNGPVRRDDFIVFVDSSNKEPEDKLDFYVLNLADWDQLVQEEFARHKMKGRVLRLENGIVIAPDGYRGINVKVSFVTSHRDCWEKITSDIEPSRTEGSI